MRTINIPILFLLYAIGHGEAFSNQKTWSIEMKSVEVTTSNPDLMDFNGFKVSRVSRGLYALSGNIVLNFEIIEGDANEMEMNMYYSSTGKNDYRALPFRIYRQHVIDILNSVYKEGAMENFASCSNLPQFEDKFDPPLVKDTYYMDKCQFDESGFPNHAQDGFYKFEVIGYGEVDWTMVLVFKLDNDV